MAPIGEDATTNETNNTLGTTIIAAGETECRLFQCLVLGGVLPMRAMMPATRSSVMPSATGLGSVTVRSTSRCAARAVWGFSARNFLILSTKQRLRHARVKQRKNNKRVSLYRVKAFWSIHPEGRVLTGPKRIKSRIKIMNQITTPPQACSTVYFDGSCPLCSIEIAHYQASLGAQQIAFVDVSDSGVSMAADLDREQAMARFHVRLPDGSLQSGAAGFVALWSALPRWRWLGRVAGHRRVLPVLERLYVMFLPWRARIARLVFRQAKSARPSSAL